MKAAQPGFPSRLPASPGALAVWCMLASFGTYACMYGFRKPFTAATYGGTEWGDSLKIWYVTAQVLGYTVSKFVGIKVVAEMPRGRRAKALLGLVGAAQIALLAFALTFLIKDNRQGFFCGLWIGVAGLALGVAAVAAWQAGWLQPFPFKVVLGVGLYLPYVAVHTVIFERLIALTREKGNIGYLMYLADSAGYLGFVGLMFGKGFLHTGKDFLPFFLALSLIILLGALLCFGVALLVYRRRFPRARVSGGP